MREKGRWNFLKAGVVIILALVFIMPSVNVFANIQTLDDDDTADMQYNIMVVQNKAGMPGDTKHINVIGVWYMEIKAYQIAMRYNASKIEIADITLRGTIGGGTGWMIDWFNYDNGTQSCVTVGVVSLYVNIPPDSGKILNITVNILDDAPLGDTVLDLFNDLDAQPALQCIYVTPETMTVYPDLFDGILTITNVTCGDVNNDEQLDIADVVYLINYMFIDGPAPQPFRCAGDCNGDSMVDIADIIFLVNYISLGGSTPGGCC